jgi:hypothetical protein
MSEAFDYHTVEDPEALADLLEVLVELPEEDAALFAGTEPQELAEAERVVLGRLGLQPRCTPDGDEVMARGRRAQLDASPAQEHPRAGSAWIAGSVPTV